MATQTIDAARNSIGERNRRVSRRHQSGVSLLEVTIALTILGFGLLAAASAQLSAMQFSTQSRARTEAQYLAQQQMETFQAMSTTSIETTRNAGTYPNDTNNPIDFDPLDGAVRQYNRSWTITPDSPENGVYTLNVAVSWTGPNGSTRTVNLESVKSEF